MVADNFSRSAFLQQRVVVLFSISDAGWYIWWCFSSHSFVSLSDIWWRYLDDLLLKVYMMHKHRGSFGHMERMLGFTFFRGSIRLAEYNALLALWWFWNMISLLRYFWYWSWKVIFVIWWKIHVETYDVKIVIFSLVRTCSNCKPTWLGSWVKVCKPTRLGTWVSYANPLDWIFDVSMRHKVMYFIEKYVWTFSMNSGGAW